MNNARARLFPPSLWAAFAATLALRFAYMHSGWVKIPPGLTEYHELARHLFKDGVFSYDGRAPSAFRLPGYPHFLCLIFYLTGDALSKPQIYVAHILLNGVTVLFLYRLVLKFGSHAWALLAAWAFAVNPTQIGIIFSEGPEIFNTLQIVLIALSLARLLEKPGAWSRWCESGLMIGWNLLTRSALMFFPWLAAGLLWSLLRDRLDRRKLLIFLGCSYVLLAPWIVRNWTLFHRVVPSEDGMGWHMVYLGTLRSDGMEPEEPGFPPRLKELFYARSWETGPYAKAEALRNIREHPLRWLGLCVGRFQYLWFHGRWAEYAFNLREGYDVYWERGERLKAAAKGFCKMLEFAFLMLAIWGMRISWPRPAARMTALLLLYQNINLLIGANPRYTMLVIPLLCIFAAGGLLHLAARAGFKDRFGAAGIDSPRPA